MTVTEADRIARLEAEIHAIKNPPDLLLDKINPKDFVAQLVQKQEAARKEREKALADAERATLQWRKDNASALDQLEAVETTIRNEHAALERRLESERQRSAQTIAELTSRHAAVRAALPPQPTA